MPKKVAYVRRKYRHIAKVCPPLYMLFCSQRNEYRFFKTIAGFIYGFFMGICIYFLIIVDLDFTEDAAFYVTFLLSLMLGFGCALSTQIRCIVLLTFPNFGGKVGRGVLKAVVIAVIIAGPLQNITVNGKEVVRVFSCTASLTYNLTKTRIKLMFEPFAEGIKQMRTDVKEVKDTIRSIKDVASPIIGEVEDESEIKKLKEENDYLDELHNDTKRSELTDQQVQNGSSLTKGETIEANRYRMNYMEKIAARCENQFTKITTKCYKVFSKGYDACYDTVTWLAAWILCWPMKLNFICNIGDVLGGVGKCDPSKELDPGFGEGYTYLKNSGQEFSKNFKEVRLQFKIEKLPVIKELRDAKNTAKAVLHKVTVRKEIFDAVMNIMKRLLAFLFLRIIIKCQQYHDKYLRRIEFDNCYITKYFRKIDARRKTQGKATLLPLKKIEGRRIIDPMSWRPLKHERQKLLKASIILLLEMITATVLVLLDRLFYEALDIVKRHAKITYTQTGKHDIHLEVVGTGLVASLLRSVIKGFNVKKRIHIEATNEVCLPTPSLLLNYFLFKIYGIYFVIWLLMVAQAYIKRFRRVICGYFYRKREKRRVLHLYNETLRRRIGFFRFMRKKVKKLAREQRLKNNLNVCHILRIKYPNQCCILKIFSYARRRCLICEEIEGIFVSDFTECPTEKCRMIYCRECWVDLGQVCYNCNLDALDTSSEDESLDDGFGDDNAGGREDDD